MSYLSNTDKIIIKICIFCLGTAFGALLCIFIAATRGGVLY